MTPSELKRQLAKIAKEQFGDLAREALDYIEELEIANSQMECKLFEIEGLLR